MLSTRMLWLRKGKRRKSKTFLGGRTFRYNQEIFKEQSLTKKK